MFIWVVFLYSIHYITLLIIYSFWFLGFKPLDSNFHLTAELLAILMAIFIASPKLLSLNQDTPNCSNTEFSLFFNFPHSVWIWEYTDQKKTPYWNTFKAVTTKKIVFFHLHPYEKAIIMFFQKDWYVPLNCLFPLSTVHTVFPLINAGPQISASL